MIVLDTNVLSEAMRPKPAREVAEWMRGESGNCLIHHHDHSG